MCPNRLLVRPISTQGDQMRLSIRTAACVSALLFASIAAAKTDTTTTLTAPTRAAPGATVTLHVVVVGRHIAYNGGGSAYGGNVQFYDPSGLIANVMSTSLNTPLVDEQFAYCSDDYTCVIPIFLGDVTTVDYPYTMPTSIGPMSFSAGYSGENYAHGSDSSPITITVRNPSVAPAVAFLLQD